MRALSAIVPDAEVGNWILMGEFRVIPRRDDYAKSFTIHCLKIVFFFTNAWNFVTISFIFISSLIIAICLNYLIYFIIVTIIGIKMKLM